MGFFSKIGKVVKKISLTAFINILLRVSYMVLSLIAIKITFNEYTSQEFIEFNYILFLVGISSFVYYPFLIDLWKTSDNNKNTGTTLALVLSFFFIIGAIALFLIKGFEIDLWLLIGAAFYGVAKYFERVNYVHQLTNQRYFAAYKLTYIILAIEYLALFLIHIFDWSVTIRLLLPGITIIYAGNELFRSKIAFTFKTSCLSIQKYLNRKNFFLIVYMGFLSMTVICDRALAYSEDENLAEILLVFSYTVSILTLFNVVVDSFRPKIIHIFEKGESLYRTWMKSSFTLLQLYFISLTIGYFIAIKLSLIPNQMFAYWWGYLTVFLLISLCNLFQITRQSNKEIKSINITWGTTLFVKLLLYTVYKSIGLSYLLFVESLICVFFITLWMNYYYELKYIRQKKIIDIG